MKYSCIGDVAIVMIIETASMIKPPCLNYGYSTGGLADRVTVSAPFSVSTSSLTRPERTEPIEFERRHLQELSECRRCGDHQLTRMGYSQSLVDSLE